MSAWLLMHFWRSRNSDLHGPLPTSAIGDGEKARRTAEINCQKPTQEVSEVRRLRTAALAPKPRWLPRPACGFQQSFDHFIAPDKPRYCVLVGPFHHMNC